MYKYLTICIYLTRHHYISKIKFFIMYVIPLIIFNGYTFYLYNELYAYEILFIPL